VKIIGYAVTQTRFESQKSATKTSRLTLSQIYHRSGARGISTMFMINYRHDDSAGDARSIYERLKRSFGKEVLFLDVSTIELGDNFVRISRENAARCSALLVIIGRGWLEAVDQYGKRRLDDPNDLVRVEITTAIQRRIRIIPVLVHGVKMPPPSALPDDIAELSQYNGIDVRHAGFQEDMDRLVKGLKALRAISAPPDIPNDNVSMLGCLPHTSFSLPRETLDKRGAALDRLASSLRKPQATADLLVPTADDVIAEQGKWVEACYDAVGPSVNPEAPDNFEHFFISIGGPNEDLRGTILSGKIWNSHTVCTWKVEYGYCRDNIEIDEFPMCVSYLGPDWKPEFKALSKAVFNKLGGVPLERFIAHP
jgi:hypothetical protein